MLFLPSISLFIQCEKSAQTTTHKQTTQRTVMNITKLTLALSLGTYIVIVVLIACEITDIERGREEFCF